MGAVRKVTKNNQEKRVAKMLAIKSTIYQLYSSILKGIILSKASIISSKYKADDLEIIDYLAMAISNKYKDNDKFLLTIGSMVYTDSMEDKVHIHPEKFEECTKYLQELVNDELIFELLDSYDPKEFKSKLLLEGAKMAVSNITGKRHDYDLEGDL